MTLNDLEPTKGFSEFFAILAAAHISRTNCDEVVILPLLARLAWKQLQICTDMLFIITSTNDELLNGINIDDL